MAYTHEGVSFFFADEAGDEIADFKDIDNYMSFGSTPSAGAELFTNGIEYNEYDPSIDPLDEDPDDYDPGEEMIDLGWTLKKLGTPHSAIYPGEPNTFGQRVFGMPFAIANKSTLGDEIDYGLQFSHCCALTITELERDLANDTIKIRTVLGQFYLSIDASDLEDSFYIGKKMVISYRIFENIPEHFSGHPSNNGQFSIPKIDIDYDMNDLECTIIGLDTSSGSTDIELHIDSPYTEENINSIDMIAPSNQQIMILPLGDGIYNPGDIDDFTPGSVSDDSFSDAPSDQGVSSWVYNNNQNTMSEPRRNSTQMLNFKLGARKIYKFRIIIWRDEENSIFSNGFHLRLPGVL